MFRDDRVIEKGFHAYLNRKNTPFPKYRLFYFFRECVKVYFYEISLKKHLHKAHGLDLKAIEKAFKGKNWFTCLTVLLVD